MVQKIITTAAIIICLTLTGCGISQQKHDKLKQEEDVKTQQAVAVNTPSPIAEHEDKLSPAEANTPGPAETNTPEPAKENNYLQITSPEDMKKDAVRDCNKLFNALAKITYDSITSNNDPLDKLLRCYTQQIDQKGKSKPYIHFGGSDNYRDVRANELFWAIHGTSFREFVINRKQRETNLPASQISNRDVTERICKDIRFFVAQLQLNDNNWRFAKFDGDSIVLEHNLPSKINVDVWKKWENSPMKEGDRLYIEGEYVKELDCWSFDLVSQFKGILTQYRVANEDKDTFYFEYFPTNYASEYNIGY